jgi:hypothetical protein
LIQHQRENIDEGPALIAGAFGRNQRVGPLHGLEMFGP